MPATSPEALARKRDRDRERLRTPEAKAAARERYVNNKPARELVQLRNLQNMHGMTPADKQAMLDTQDGRCYLCGDSLTYDKAVIEHDHRCCPPVPTRRGVRTGSCPYCRRGLACGRCNTLIGMAGDDPGRLRRIADALAAAQAAVDARLAAKPRQLALDIPAA